MAMVIAHRGVSSVAPENTHAAFNLAWAQDFAGIELDVQVSADGEVVVFHDECTGRICVENFVIAKTDWSVLRGLDTGAHCGQVYMGERIPLLAEVLENMPSGKVVQVEIKPEVVNLAPVIEVLKNVRQDITIYVMSFSIEILKVLQRELSDLAMLWIVDKDEASNITNVIDIAKSSHFTGVDVYYQVVDVDYGLAMRDAGLILGVWMVDEPAVVKRLGECCVEMIASNVPHLVS